MRVKAQIDVSAPREVVWDWITDPAKQLHFLSGVTRWEVSGDQDRGCGARYRMLMRVGSAEVGGLVEVVEIIDEGAHYVVLDYLCERAAASSWRATTCRK